MCKLKEEDTLLVFVKVTFLKGLAHTDLALKKKIGMDFYCFR